MTAPLPGRARIVIVGAGFGGLGLAIRLRQLGHDDVVVLEKASAIGGTWRDNTYPGCACDVPSHLYSFSFAPHPGWTRMFSPQPEIEAYLTRVAEEHEVLGSVWLDTALVEAAWDEAARCWRVVTSRGDLTCDVLVTATGALHEPLVPDLPGLEGFPGVTFHSATWRHDVDLTGQRVAVVGTGASAIQFVPQIVPQVRELTLFQRTAPWVMPRQDRAITRAERWLFRRFPLLQRIYRSRVYWGRETYVVAFTGGRRLMALGEKAARAHLRRQVADPALRRRLTPTFSLGCKRVLLSNDYYPSLAREHVTVAATGVREVRDSTVVGTDGTEAEVDVIIFGTGFHVTDQPIGRQVRGVGGRTLDEVWQGSPKAYLCTTIAGFPNLFMMVGPNSGLGHSSIIYMIEAQVAYITDALAVMERDRLAAVEVRPEVQAAFVAEMDRRLSGSVWDDGGCASWYVDATGRNSTLWPTFTFRFRRRTERFDSESYELTRVARPVG